MKKFVAILLAALMVLANVAALAEPAAPDLDDVFNSFPGDDTTVQPITDYTGAAAATHPFIRKVYDLPAGATTSPVETLSFTLVGEVEVPDGFTGTAPAVEIPDFDVDGTDTQYAIPVSVPEVTEYTVPGMYRYTFNEEVGDNEKVIYQAAGQTAAGGDVDSDPTPIYVEVWIANKLDADNNPTGEFEQTIVAFIGDYTVGDPESKQDTITNGYDYETGDLEITKTVTGNMADANQYFDVTLVLTTTDDNPVLTPIAITIDDAEEQALTSGVLNETKDALTANWGDTLSQTVTFKIKDGQTVTFTGIPSGVLWAVAETTVDGEDIVDTPATDQLHDKDAANDKTIYDVSINGNDTTEDNGEIPADDIAKAEIVNNKVFEDIPNTGITLETVPYVLIAMITVAGAMMLVARKRDEY